MSKKAVLIHGWEGSPDLAWFPWLRQKLEHDNWEIIAPQLPNPAKPQMDLWLEHLDKLLPNVDENYFLVGHSLGCITILRFLERLHADTKVGGATLVAGFNSNLGYAELNSFFPNDIDWSKIKLHCDKFVAIHSDNDPFVSTHYADIFKEQLNAQIILEHGAGHFSEEDKIDKMPSIYQSMKNL